MKCYTYRFFFDCGIAYGCVDDIVATTFQDSKEKAIQAIVEKIPYMLECSFHFRRLDDKYEGGFFKKRCTCEEDDCRICSEYVDPDTTIEEFLKKDIAESIEENDTVTTVVQAGTYGE